MTLLRITHGGGNYTHGMNQKVLGEESMVGIDEVETGPLAFAPNSTDDSSNT